MKRDRRIAETVTRIDVSRRVLLQFGYAAISSNAVSGNAVSGNGQPTPIWIDQDGGWEDIAAIAILLRSPDVEVQGISTTPGIADPKTAHSRVDLLLAAVKERKATQVDDIPAKAHILATGPLSRIARLIQAGKPPASLTWMGGAIDAKGNHKSGAEWNAAVDPKALKAVLASTVPFTLCPLDLTNRFPSATDVISHSVSGVLADIRNAYSEKDRSWWDELAAASIAAPGLFQSEKRMLDSDMRGRIFRSPKGREVTVLTACDASGFRNLLERSLRF